MKKMDPHVVVRMYEVELLTIREIAKRLNASYGGVHRIVSKYSKPRPPGYRAQKTDEPFPCGSKRAYQRHLDRGEEPDELCKKANRDYTSDFDRRTGTSRARNRAYRRLARSHPDAFQALLSEEKDRAQDTSIPLSSGSWHSRARERAHRRLAKLYPNTFQEILKEEKATVKAEIRNEAEHGEC